MKRSLLVIALLLFTQVVMAQAQLSDLTLDEACKKAKQENKTVIVMASATW